MKKLDVFIEVRQIVGRLKPFEAEVTRNYLSAFDRKNREGNNKSLAAFDLIVGNDKLSYEDLKSAISPNVNKYTFNKFLARLRDKIFDSLLLDLNIQRKGSYSDWFRTRQSCTKRWVLIINLIGRGNESSALQLLREQIKTCEQYELYDLLSSAYHIEANIGGLREGPKYFEKLQQRMKWAEKCRDAEYKALHWNTKYYMTADRKASQSEQFGMLTEALADLQQLFTETNVGKVGKLALTFAMEYHQQVGELEDARQAGQQLLQLVRERKSLHTPTDRTTSYAQVAYNDFLMRDFEHGLRQLEHALEGAGVGSYNFIVLMTLKATMQYFSSDVDDAMDTVENMLHSSFIGIANTERCKLTYIKACLLFNAGAYSQAYQLFQSDNILMESDPEGWNIGVRVMSILCLIEMQLEDMADLFIESLRKFIKQNENERDYKPRDKAILSVLRSLEHCSFDFAKTYFKNQDLFALLESDHPEYRWQIKSHEFIVFHEWFLAKVAQSQYQFKMPDAIPFAGIEKPDKP